jgi:hypothetical protein
MYRVKDITESIVVLVVLLVLAFPNCGWVFWPRLGALDGVLKSIVSAKRACLLPALVIGPRITLFPDECSEGDNAR